MSETVTAPPGEASEKKSIPLIRKVIWGAIILGLLFLLIKPKFQDYRERQKAKQKIEEKEKLEQENESYSYSLPPLPSREFEIVDVNSEKYEFPIGYILTFVCNQDYVVIDDEGHEYHGKAGQDVDIGTICSTESLRNLYLRFRTENKGLKATMKILLTPMQPKKK